MNDELMKEAMEEAVEETIPTAQAIVEEAIAPAAQEIVQETIPAIEPKLEVKAPKHSKLKTFGLIVTVTAIVAAKPITKTYKGHKEKQKAKRQAEFNAWYDERRAQEIAAYEAKRKLEEANAADSAPAEPSNETTES